MIPNKNQPKNIYKIASFEEIQIKVPWGHISAKKFPRLKELSKSTCSSDEDQTHQADPQPFDKSLPVLCFHGWLDNAGTFDRLIPLIQDVHPDLEFYSFDWPGHGKSSNRPDSIYTNSSIYISDIARIVNYMNLDKTGFNGMGHSMGGNALCAYACVFPNKIRNLVRIESEGYEPINRNVSGFAEDLESGYMNKFLKRAIETQIAYDNSFKSRPTNEYTFEEAKSRLMKGSNFGGYQVGSSVDEDHIHIMLERGLRPGEIDKNKFCFTRDVKLILPSFPFFTVEIGHNLLKNGYKHNTHNELQIQANYNCWYDMTINKNPKIYEDFYKNFDQISLYSQNRNYHLVCAEGNHHLHLNHPEVFIEKLNAWIGNTRDRSFAIDGLVLRDLRTSKELKDKCGLA